MLSELDLWFSQSAGWAHSAWAHAYEHRQRYIQVQNRRYQQEDDEEVEEQLRTCWTIPLTLPCASDRKPSPHEAFSLEHWGGRQAVTAAVTEQLGWLTQVVSVARSPLTLNPPQDKAECTSVPVSSPTTASEDDSLEKHYMRRTEIHGTANKLILKTHNAHVGLHDQNFKYKIHLLLLYWKTFSAFHWDFVPCPPAGEDCGNSSGWCSALSHKTDAELDK